MNGEATRFKIGNKEAEKWSKEDVSEIIEKMYANTEDDEEILCFSDACKSVGFRDSHFDYLMKKFPVFESTKKDIQKRIVSRINKAALNNDKNVTASIWRMKQLGETDKVENHNINEDITQELTEKERKERIKELRKKLGDK